MKKAYKIALFAALILLSLSSHAQYFDWVKSYSGQDPAGGGVANKPVGIVHDSEGNIYYLGQFGVGAGIDTTHFLPIAPSGPGINTAGAVIAKFSPTGEMLWHKVVYSNNGQHTSAFQIQMVSDTAIACLMQLNQPNGYNQYTYFLDTLLRDYDGYFVDNDSILKGSISALLTFNLDGELVERHILQTAYYDTVGNPVMVYGKILTQPLGAHHFCIDNDGNIILLRTAQDYVPGYGFASSGLVSGIRFIVDGNRYFDFHFPVLPQNWEHQILKFTPHFNDLLYAKYFIEPSESFTFNTLTEIQFSSMQCDSLGNYYVTATIMLPRQDIPVTDDSLFVIRSRGNTWHGVLIKYLPNGEVAYGKQLDYLENAGEPADVMRAAPAIDYTDSCIAIPFAAGEDNGNIFIDSIPLHLTRGIGFLRFNMNDGRFLSCGKATASVSCGINSGALAMNNNRVAIQTQYLGELRDSSRILAQTQTNYGGWGLGITLWNYSGSALYHIDYNTQSSGSEPGPLFFHDSSLFSCGMLKGSATFGTNNISYTDNSIAYLARYVDTAFLSPYRSDNDTNDSDTGSVRIIMVGDGDAFVAYPNPFRQRVVIEMKNEELRMKNGTVTAILTDLSGRREEVRLTPIGHSSNNAITQSSNHIYTLDLTSRPQATYLLTLTTADGKQHTLRLMKMSDIFSR